MKTFQTGIFFILLIFFAFGAEARQGTSLDLFADYSRALHTGDEQLMRTCFAENPETKFLDKSGKYVNSPDLFFKKEQKIGKVKRLGGTEKGLIAYIGLEIKINNPAGRRHEFLQLLKTDEGWKITGRIIHESAGKIAKTPAGSPDFYAVLDRGHQYFTAHQFNDTDIFRECMYEDAHLKFVADGKIKAIKIVDYIRGFENNKGKKNPRKNRFVNIEIYGNIALLSIELDIPTINKTFTDFHALLKIKGSWRIVNKIAWNELTKK